MKYVKKQYNEETSEESLQSHRIQIPW